MTHNVQDHCGTPLGQPQDVSRNPGGNTSSFVPSQTFPLEKPDTNSSTSTVSTDDDTSTHKKSNVVRIDVAGDDDDDDYNNEDHSDRPQMTRAVSYGAAAPYVPYDANLFNFNDVVKNASLRPSRRGSYLSEKTVDHAESQLPPASRVSTDANGHTYPEGGREAWLVVFGAFCGNMGAMGVMNTLGTIQTYVSEHQLKGTSESTIGWIFSIYTFLAFFCGIQIGPLFDAFGPRYLIGPGSVFVLLLWFLLGLCTQYWHFIIVFSICGGIGTSLVFTPAITAVGHFFLRKRGLCTGISAVGGGLGGVIYPLILQALFPKVGFAWATRVIGFITLLLFIVANCFIRSRLPRKEVTAEAIMPDLKIFRDPIYSLTTAAIFFVELGLFIPLAYLPAYALSRGIDTDLSYQLVAFFNVGSCFGRWLPGFVADRIGRFNTIIIMIAMCLITTLAIWLPAGSSVGAIIAYDVLFGFASGSGISLTPVCVSQLCKIEDYGRYYATCYTVVSFACLTGIPIAGALITAANGAYWGLIVFTGAAYGVAVAAFIGARIMGVGWGLTKVY